MQDGPRSALILGCGFTGTRVARLLLDGGWSVTATTRNPQSLAQLQTLGARIVAFDAGLDVRAGASAEGAVVLLSVPTLRLDGRLEEVTPKVLAELDGRPEHIVYLSTTGVYGRTAVVDESTPVAPETERQTLRTAAESAVQSMPCGSLVLRPAAIYGPHRGVHESMRSGRFRLAAGSPKPVSRIHVDDLAVIVATAMTSQLKGAFPVADRRPASSEEVARFCADLLEVPVPARVEAGHLAETRQAGRSVDGKAVLETLGLDLRYPTFREGIPASILAERMA